MQLSFTSTVTVRGLREDRPPVSAGGKAGLGGSCWGQAKWAQGCYLVGRGCEERMWNGRGLGS